MSAAAARSPSPGPARPCCGLRRSADSSPFRPIASTPDSPQRSASVGKTGGRARASWSEKENDSNNPRDAARTPKAAARHSSGGGGAAKSFMAPTFSAASKAVAPSPSPRKKILGERNNDPPHQQHPIPSSPGEMAHGKPSGPPPPPPEEPLGEPRRLRLSLDGAPPAPPVAAPVAAHGAWRSLGAEAEEEEEVVVENPVCKIHHHHHDESGGAAAPYDPKTNYLSPRPRFLRYRPNPRVEQYRQGSSGGGGRRLEDGFPSSESSEEADTTTTTEEEEEGLSEEEQEQGPASPEEVSPLAPASDAKADAATPIEAGVLALKPDPAPVSPLPRVQAPEPEVPTATSPRARSPTPELEQAATPARACAKKKKGSSLRFLLVAPLALVLFMVASLVCVPPPPGSPVVLNASLSKVSGYFLSVQELHPVELAAWLKQWSSSSLDFVTSYWNALASSQEQEFFGPRTAANLSAAAEDDHGVCFYYSAAETRAVPTEQESISASIFEQGLEIQEVVSASDSVVIAERELEEMAAFAGATIEGEPTDDAEIVQESVSATSDVIEEELNELDAEMAEEVSGSSGEEMASFNQDLDIPSQPEPESEHVVDDMDMPSLQQDVQTDGSEGDQDAHVKEDQEAHHGQKFGSDMWSGHLDELSKPAVAGSILAVIIGSAALAFHYMRQNQAHVSLNSSEPAELEPAEHETAEPVEQDENRSSSGSSEGHALAKGSQLQYPAVKETERIGGSGGSQYSSSLSSGLGRRKKEKVEESLQSLEPTLRRDSIAQSTSSYGSFTTYEKIPAKKKNKEEEAMTPVRRSSRLRNQVKSPEA